MRDWKGTSRTSERLSYGVFGMDRTPRWAGWLTASDAVTGARRWQFKAPAPVLSGVTPTAGGIVRFGDISGNF